MNTHHLTTAIACGLIALALLCVISLWLALVYFVCALVVLVAGAILGSRSPIDPPWADESNWFNCPHCSVSFTKEGRIETFTPKICAPMSLCPQCKPKVRDEVQKHLNNHFALKRAARN